MATLKEISEAVKVVKKTGNNKIYRFTWKTLKMSLRLHSGLKKRLISAKNKEKKIPDQVTELFE